MTKQTNFASDEEYQSLDDSEKECEFEIVY